MPCARTSGRSLTTACWASTAAGGFVLEGLSPWVTGATQAETIVVGATLEDGRQLLAALDTLNAELAAEAADLLFRGVELATVPQREHRHEELVQQIKAAGIDPTHPGFAHFLAAIKHGLPPHGGCGLGIDRLTQKVVGLANVKEAILFPRDINRLAP